MVLMALTTALMWANPVAAQDDIGDIVAERQVSYVQALIDSEPSVPMHYMRMAQAYAAQGQESQVLRYTEEAVRRGGSVLAADIMVGDFYFNQGRYEDALLRYDNVLRQSPRQSHVLIRVWMIIQRSRADNIGLSFDLNGMIRDLNNAGMHIGLRPPANNAGQARSRLVEANRMLNENNISGAVGAYKAAADLDPWNPDIYRGLGVAFARSKDQVRALGAYQLYIALAPPDRADVPRVRQIIIDFYSSGLK